jgi:hypothetical protein
MLITGKLFDHLTEIDEQAQEMLELLKKQAAGSFYLPADLY